MKNLELSRIFYICCIGIFIINVLFLIYLVINILNIYFLKLLFIFNIIVSISCFFIFNYFSQRSKEIIARMELDISKALEKLNKEFTKEEKNNEKYISKEMEIFNCDFKYSINEYFIEIIKFGKIISLITVTLFITYSIIDKNNNYLNIVN
ncbi:MAG: hypothetical protein LBG94_10945 [Treponema sp.]|jgi:hypothetical protein|nr:hypothetical protein [Treponema sp.]